MTEILPRVQQSLQSRRCSLQAVIQHYNGAHLLTERAFPLEASTLAGQPMDVESEGAWRLTCTLAAVPERPDAFDLRLCFTRQAGRATECAVGVQLVFEAWSSENYVLMPAAVYQGNRFESRRMAYPPILSDPADIGVDVPTIISDVPRLNLHAGPSRIQQITRDLATPAVGIYDPAARQAFWLLTEQATRLGDSGLTLEENESRTQAVLTLNAPGMRQDVRYTIADTQKACDDRAADFGAGDEVELHLRFYFFPEPRLQGLFDRFVEIRKDLTTAARLQHNLPFSSAWEIQEAKYNRWNWDETHGYYAVGIRDESPYNHWQVGWVGGLMSTYPLLALGGPLSRQRALRTFDFVFPAGQAASGFLYGCGKDGQWFGDHFKDPSLPWLLIRKNSDALYFIFKQFLLLQKQDPSWQPPAHWLDGARRCADAFVRLWQRYGQFGQFVDVHSGELLVGGSASAGTAPAGLALAAQFLGDETYLRVARESAAFLYRNFVQKGYTTGGPGEILQCPDSESAFGLLELLVVLYEVTQEAQWLTMAIEQANQCFTWCVSYDFQFPPESTFGRLDMLTTGSVYANVQNKHSAPGICTLSGDTLFKLFRASGDRRYLTLIQEIAHNLPQYLSRDDRPISGMPVGWMNERVEMSDWLEPVGEIFYGSCWCEISNMLAYCELPGLYVQPDSGLVCALDHIDAEISTSTPERLVLRLSNATRFEARVRLFVEDSSEMGRPLGQNGLIDCPQIPIPAGTKTEVELHRSALGQWSVNV